jgi:hypothetical protein
MLVLIILTALWHDSGIVFKIKVGVPDLIAGTVFISTKEQKKANFSSRIINWFKGGK